MFTWQRYLSAVLLATTSLVAASASAQLPFLEDDSGYITAPGSDPVELPSSDDYLDVETLTGDSFSDGAGEGMWVWQTVPTSLMYRAYLASPKQSRMYGGIDEMKGDHRLWDNTLGAQVGLFRYGTTDYILPDGFQLDAEGSAQVRLDIDEQVDVRSVDFRGGVPLSYGSGPHRFKIGYYHISAHLGDEFVLKNPNFDRLNFSRDVIVGGYSYYATPNLRLYGEVGWAFYSIISEPWEVQFGLDYAPQQRTGVWGAPFFAVNGHLREEVDFSGSLNAQAGWAWRADNGPGLLRMGFQYFNGLSNQYSFYARHEETLGFGVWYDF